MNVIFASTVFCESLDERLIYKLYKETSGKDKDFKTFFEISSGVAFESFAIRFDRAIVSLKEVPDHYENQWMLSNYHICPQLGEFTNYFDRIIKEKGGIKKIKAELNKISNYILFNKKEIKVLKDKLSKDENKLLEYTQLGIYVRDIRKEPIQKIIALISNIVREIFKRKKYPAR